jgi:uncharacterized protein YjiK
MINLDKNMNKGKANLKTLPTCLLLAVVLLLLASCESKHVIYTPRGYDISKPEAHDLGTKLDEISGICWINDTMMLANNDESGKIFAINLKDLGEKEYRNVKFGNKDDYEDIVKVEDAIYVLVSTGKILKVTGYRSQDSVVAETVGVLPGDKNEFESLYYDKEVNSLVMLCKNCHKEKDNIRSAYRFDLATSQLIDTPYYQINMDEIRMKINDSGLDFRPSAATINPKDNKLYIVSAVGNLLVVADKKGKVENAFRISGIDFPQPEGITFADNGDMYISNEVATEQQATLLMFKYIDPSGAKQKP